MTDNPPTPRRRPLWGVFIVPILVLIAAIAWSGFWFYAASRVGVQADAWRAHEAKSGRIFDCARRSVAGFPFRLEITCDGPSVALVSQTAGQDAAATPVKGKLDKIEVVAQIYDPKHVVAVFTPPATLATAGAQPSFIVNWSKGLSSVIGLPGTPERGALVFDNATIDRLDGSMQVPLASAKHIELHGRIVHNPSSRDPDFETVLEISHGAIQGVHPLLAEPFDADVHGILSGLKDLSPKPWPERFRELQAAGGHVEIVQSRIQQGDLIAVAAGKLGLSPGGRLDGELQMTVAGIEKVIPALGIQKMLEQGVPQATLDRIAPGIKTQDINNLFGALDRAVPGLGQAVKQNASLGVAAAVNALGKETVLEGKKARSFPLRFADGAVFLGPIKVGDIPPLF